MNQSTAENNAIALENPAPEIGKIGSIEGFARSEAQGRHLIGGEGLRCDGQREFGLRGTGETAELERLSVGGHQDAARTHRVPGDLENGRFFNRQALYESVFKYQRATFGGGPRQAAEHLARIDCATRHFFGHTQGAWIAPCNGRIGQYAFPADFQGTGKLKITLDLQL